MDLIIGANSKVAQAYLHRTGKGIEDTILVHRSKVNNSTLSHTPLLSICQDLTEGSWTESGLKPVLEYAQISRIIYFASRNTDNPGTLEEYEEVNSRPVRRIIDTVSERKIPFIYFSTDMIFGDKNTPNREDDTRFNAINDYARSKLKGETETMKYDKGIVIRLGNVLGVQGDFLSFVAGEVNSERDVNCWTNVSNRFTGIEDITTALNALRNYTGSQRIFHLVSPDQPISRYDIAMKFIDLCEDNGRIACDSTQFVRESRASGKPEVLCLDGTKTYEELGLEQVSILDQLKQIILESSYPFGG